MTSSAEYFAQGDRPLGYKALTYDRRGPWRGGPPLFETLPCTTAAVELDHSMSECAPGWHYCETLAEALRTCSLWPGGYSALCLRVRPLGDRIARGTKRRCSQLVLESVVPDSQIREAIREISAPLGELADVVASEQWAWFEALRRPRRDPRDVERGLRRALRARGLEDWTLVRYGSARAAHNARDTGRAWLGPNRGSPWRAWAGDVLAQAHAAWRDDRDAWTRTGWSAGDAHSAAERIQRAWAIRDTDPVRASRAPGVSWQVWAALVVYYAASRGWIEQPRDLLTTGLRDAFAAGLAAVYPSAAGQLAWAMQEGCGERAART